MSNKCMLTHTGSVCIGKIFCLSFNLLASRIAGRILKSEFRTDFSFNALYLLATIATVKIKTKVNDAAWNLSRASRKFIARNSPKALKARYKKYTTYIANIDIKYN